MSLTAPAPSVYVGAWTNWTNGRVQGSTLTLTSRDGALLIAFLALYVRFAGNHLWDILCYLIFLLRSSNKRQNGLFYQQQAILRTKASDLTLAVQLVSIGWQWRKVVPGVVQKIWPLIIVALLHTAAIAVAGIFSSRVTSTLSEVLLNEVHCGQWNELLTVEGTFYNQQAAKADFITRSQKNSYTGSAYAASCYGSTLVNTSWEDCSALGREQISWTMETNISCPFASEMCMGGHAVRFDTGMVDSHLQLGINAPKKDRVAYRRLMECAPIVQEGFEKGPFNASEAGVPEVWLSDFNPGESFIGYYYGPNTAVRTPATFYYANESFAISLGNGIQLGDYQLDVESFTPRSNSAATALGTFQAIPQLTKLDADLLMVFMSKNVAFIERVDDPWFTATVPEVSEVERPDGSLHNITTYYPSDPVSVMGCLEQWTWCNVANGKCMPFYGSLSDPAWDAAVAALDLNSRQNATMLRLSAAAGSASVHNIIQNLGTSSLLATQYSNGGESGPLPSNQWILELAHWFGTAMATAQLQILQYVTGDGDPAFWHYQVKPTDPNAEWMCTNQIAQRNDYASFSVLGLSLILIIGAIFILVNTILSNCISPKEIDDSYHGGKQSRLRDWVLQGPLQMQRMVFEGSGGRRGVWKRTESDTIPVTEKDSKWALAWYEVGKNVEDGDGDSDSRHHSSMVHLKLTQTQTQTSGQEPQIARKDTVRQATDHLQNDLGGDELDRKSGVGMGWAVERRDTDANAGADSGYYGPVEESTQLLIQGPPVLPPFAKVSGVWPEMIQFEHDFGAID